MTKNWIAALAVLVVAGACHASGTGVKDKEAPTSFATVGCTTAPVPVESCPGTCCGCMKDYPCLAKAKDWLCFKPLRTCPCECKHCGSCRPPLYVYFLRPCVEGAGCYHYPDNCSSCVRNNCGSSSCGSGTGLGLGQRLFHRDCSADRSSCK